MHVSSSWTAWARPSAFSHPTQEATLADHTELYKQFSDNESFNKWLSDSIFAVTYEESGKRSA